MAVPRRRHATPGRIGRVGRQAVPRPRVIMALVLLLGLVCTMLLDGYLRAEVGNDQRVRSNASADTVPDEVLEGGPILSFPGGPARSQSVPDKTIVLTFDDGPDPEWSEKVLDILDENDVPGTFFLVGSMISRYPDVVRRMVDEGDEVGVHTFTHVDLSYQSEARVKREIAQTQLALAGATGITTTLFRAPYSSRTDAIDDYSWPVYQRLGAMGYTSVFIDTDSEDWQLPGVSKIVEWATPEDGEGASVLFHDAAWRPLRDTGRAAPIHQEDEGEGLHLHHRQRRAAAGRDRRRMRPAGTGTAPRGRARRRATPSRPRTARRTPRVSGKAAPCSPPSPWRNGACRDWPPCSPSSGSRSWPASA